MDCVKLYFKESLIGVLTYDYKNEHYLFVKNKFFTNQYIHEIMGLNEKEVYCSKHLFSFFLSFLKKYGSNDYSDDYKELIKIASLQFDKNQFWIGA